MSSDTVVDDIPLEAHPSAVGSDKRPDEEKQVLEDSTPVHVLPDGGWRSWLTVVGAWCFSSVCFGYTNAFGVYQTYYVTTLLPSSSTSAISWIGSLQIFFLYATSLISGPLFDLGYCRHMLIGGSILYVGCVFAQAQAQTDAYYQVFLSQGLGQGIAMGLLYLPGMGVILQHFDKNRSLAMGLAFTGSSSGGIIFPIMLNNIFANRGYQWGVRAAGFYILGICIVANLLIKPLYAPKGSKKPLPPVSKLFRDAPYAVSTLGCIFAAFGLFFVFFYIQLFTLTRGGISQTFSFYTLAILNGASVFGRTVPNIFADKIGISCILVPFTGIAGAIVFVMFALKNVGGITIFCILYGFTTGAYVSLTGPFFAAMADHPSEMGLRMGLAMACIGLAALVGTPIDGALVGNAGLTGGEYTWWKAIVWSAIMMLVGTAVLGWGAVLLARKKGRWV